MPKAGLSHREWKNRLRQYALGEFVFGRGQRPTSGSRWSKELLKIENCPRHIGADRDLYGNPLQCICLYHQKQVCRKLQGKGAKSVQWATNIGNERGEILISVLTTSESMTSLKDMANGLMNRYEYGKYPPPKVLYTDRECCNQAGPSKYKLLFSKWPDLEVRLDIWHFMRRLALGCSSESHPLYGTFMSRLSSAIFEWDKSDLDKLKAAKKKEMQISGIPNPSDSAVRKAITKQELERHCRRRTRGSRKTEESIESLILALSGVTDSLGVPILKSEITDIWSEQKKHIDCIQDVSGIQLYTVIGDLTKGGNTLPVFRCARGSTSLESFHSHLVKFIPGTSANAVHFQAYLLDGITRWNYLRSGAALENQVATPLRTFDLRLIERVNKLSQTLHQKNIVPVKFVPSTYTEELIGVEYLYSQSGLTLPVDDKLDAEIDEGFEDYEEETDAKYPISASLIEDELPAGSVCDDTESESDDADDVIIVEETDSLDSRGIPGWDKVDALAQALVALTGISVSLSEAENIKALYNNLLEFDKRPISYTTRAKKPTRGKFSRSKSGHIGVEAVKRCFLAAGSPASDPSKSRVVEAICIHLCEQFQSPKKEGVYVSRWKLILSAYNKVRQRLLNSEKLLEDTNLVLFSINETTITRWFKDQTRRDEVKLLLQGVQLPEKLNISAEILPLAVNRPSSAVLPEHPMEFEEAEDTIGKAVRKGVKRKVASPEETGTQPSRTTLWRRRKQESTDQTGRKVYTCKVCEKPMSSEGHTQFRGQRYCPNAPGQIPKEDWLKSKKLEADNKKKAK